MADVQAENGFTRFAHKLIEAYCRTEFGGHEGRVFMFIARKTYGFNKKLDRISLSQFARGTGIERRNCYRILIRLEARNIIVVKHDDKRSIRYGIQKNYDLWKSVSRMTPVVVCLKNDDTSLSGMTTKSLSKLTHTIETKETLKKGEVASHDEPQTSTPKPTKDPKYNQAMGYTETEPKPLQQTQTPEPETDDPQVSRERQKEFFAQQGRNHEPKQIKAVEHVHGQPHPSEPLHVPEDVEAELEAIRLKRETIKHKPDTVVDKPEQDVVESEAEEVETETEDADLSGVPF